MTKKSINERRFEVIIQEDENGDLILPIPPQVLNTLGWKEGDNLKIDISEYGNFLLSKE